MAGSFGTNPSDLIAAIGPGIGFCCFEVGPEVEEQFAMLFPERLDSRHVDLAEANRRQLVTSGLDPAHIDASQLCTVCHNSAEFHSYRRDRDNSGRMVSAIGIVEK
jgi:copper oxidase (laccase) domain-containing protein